MLKALLKKQFAEFLGSMVRKSSAKKSSSGMSKGMIALYVVLFGYLFIIFGGMFYMMADSLCAPLRYLGLDWLYFALCSITASVMGVIGSVFTTYNCLYKARDNEMLLSMPIPPWMILFVRMIVVYLSAFMFEATVIIPAYIAYFASGGTSVMAIVSCVLMVFILPFLSVTISCILGWLIALIAEKIPFKNIIVVILSIGFIAAYYYVYSQIFTLLGKLVANSEAVGGVIRRYLALFYLNGLAMQGDILPLVGFIAIVAVIFGAVYVLLSVSFIKLATTKRGSAKVKYRAKAMKSASAQSALLRKEFAKFVSSSVYMLNSGIGAVLMLVAAVAVIIKSGTVKDMLAELSGVGVDFTAIMPLVGCGAVMMISTMNMVTAPSISLEGNNLWLMQSLPIKTIQPLVAKLTLHLLVSVIPSFVMYTALFAVMSKIDVPMILLGYVAILLFNVVSAEFGLVMNLRFPNFAWTNEAVAVKQGVSVLLSMLGNFTLIIVLVGGFLLLADFVLPIVYLIIAILLLAVMSTVLWLVIKGWGAKTFASF